MNEDSSTQVMVDKDLYLNHNLSFSTLKNKFKGTRFPSITQKTTENFSPITMVKPQPSPSSLTARALGISTLEHLKLQKIITDQDRPNQKFSLYKKHNTV